MIKIYHIEGRRSERVAWLLEEIGGIPYELDFIQGDVLGSLLKLESTHPTRMTPIVRDGDLVLVESGAILEYLLGKYAKGSPLRPREDTPEFAQYLQFMHYAEGTGMARVAMDMFLGQLLEKTGADSPLPRLPGLAGSRTESQRVMHFADDVLATRRYFAGDSFTAADIMMHFPLKLGAPIATKNKMTVAEINRTDHAYLDVFPNVKRFLVEMSERPAFQRAMKTTMPAGPPPM